MNQMAPQYTVDPSSHCGVLMNRQVNDDNNRLNGSLQCLISGIRISREDIRHWGYEEKRAPAT